MKAALRSARGKRLYGLVHTFGRGIPLRGFGYKRETVCRAGLTGCGETTDGGGALRG